MDYRNRAYDYLTRAYHYLIRVYEWVVGRIVACREWMLPAWRWFRRFFPVIWFLLWIMACIVDSLHPEVRPTPLAWILDPVAPYHVVASLPDEAFLAKYQITKLNIGFDADWPPDNPVGFNNGEWEDGAVDFAGFYHLPDKLDPHHHDLVAKSWPDNRGVGVSLGHDVGIVEFTADLRIYDPESRRRGPGVWIEHVALVPGAKGGDRLSLPRLLKEGWVLVGKQEMQESREAARQRKRDELWDPSLQTSSSGGYAWDGGKEFQGQKEGGWKDWADPDEHRYLFNYLTKKKNKHANRGAVPVLWLRHRLRGITLKATLQGDAWIVHTLVEDHRPLPKRWWIRFFLAVVDYAKSWLRLQDWLWPKIVGRWQKIRDAVEIYYVRGVDG